MKEHSVLEATPEKRLFWSIISDYGLKTGVCELVDNAIDLWKRSGSKDTLNVDIEIDVEQQSIAISDNAGGLEEADLPKLVTPGGSENDPMGRSIGIFGVGSKRAGVALGQTFRIKTRFRDKKTFLIQIDDDWLNDESWEIRSFEVGDIKRGSTEVEITNLRAPVTTNDVVELAGHLSAAYGRFLTDGLTICLNGAAIDPVVFDHWTYPPEVMPRRFEMALNVADLGEIDVLLEAGLIRDRDPEAANYGVYVYCNDRLIVRDWKERAVGYYVSTEAGVPHPDASLARVIVSFSGPARAMPWNSSKNGINTTHRVFEAVQKRIVELSSHYTKASRRWKNDWDDKVYRHAKGQIEIATLDPGEKTRLRLPPAPKGAKHYSTSIKDLNAGLIDRKPWTLGLIEGMAASKLLSGQKFATRNRMALILLDSNLEIAFKEFIVNNRDKFPSKKYTDDFIKNLFKNRSDVISHVSNVVAISTEEKKKMESYYLKRNKLIHERATVDVSAEEVEIYRKLVEVILRKLFSVRFPSL